MNQSKEKSRCPKCGEEMDTNFVQYHTVKCHSTPKEKCCDHCNEILRGNFKNNIPIVFCNNHSCLCHSTDTWVEKEEGPKHPEHICAFNDAPQSCDCFDAGFEKGRQEGAAQFKESVLKSLPKYLEPTLCGKCNLNGPLCEECYANRRANTCLSQIGDIITNLDITNLKG